jgi:hypothetical protein
MAKVRKSKENRPRHKTSPTSPKSPLGLSNRTEEKAGRATAAAAKKTQAALNQVRINPSEDEHAEDADDIQVLRERLDEPFLTREEFLRKHGRL